jgi:two-component system, chemotaxis family, protein-glutamate methylesterase/glutaminase
MSEPDPVREASPAPVPGRLAARRDLIVVGASAGGVQALTELVKHLPADLPATVLVVLHLGPGRSALPEILNRAGALPASHPQHGEPLRRGHIYAAPPERHLTVRDGTLHLLKGPKENGHRPAIDVLFRSAARSRRQRVMGVVLSGNLDDGTAGLLAIKKYGGVAVVQDPQEADYPSMPLSALRSIKIDHVLPVAEIADLIVRHANAPIVPVEAPESKEDPVHDEKLGEAGEEEGVPSGFTCPDCGGALWEWKDGELARFRCRTGHAFSPESLVDAQEEALEAALWASLRALEERASMARRIARRMHNTHLDAAATRYETEANAADHHATLLRGILSGGAGSEN